ncbi:MAG: SDR family oxidoreductase [Kiritimatiellae bacterium]|nr:SDR family oxidoreductase [Kiritimatiellia bacterium]
MNLKDKAVLITGAGVRVGRGLAEALAAEGCRLALHCNRSARKAEALADKLQSGGGRAAVLKCDLRKPRAGEIMIKRALHALGRLDAIINNAAVFNREKLAGGTEKHIRGTLEINLLAPVLLTRAFAGIIGRGKIINILDRRVSGFEPGLAAYLLSKKALADFTGIAALELAPDIAVNGVAPGPVLAQMKGKAREKAGKIPLNRRPTIADLAAAVIFLLKSDAITGEIIFVDGGQHLLGNMSG